MELSSFWVLTQHIETNLWKHEENDENDKIVSDKIDSMISSGSVVANRSSMFNDDVISALQNLLIREHLDVKSS